MANNSQLDGEPSNHLEMENPKHGEVVRKVMEKWQGEGFAARSNEGQAVQAAISRCEYLQGEAKAVAPTGRMFDVESKNLSDRVYSKYGGENKMMSKNEGPAENPAAKGSLSDRKYK
jgi:hypothetical protein